MKSADPGVSATIDRSGVLSDELMTITCGVPGTGELVIKQSLPSTVDLGVEAPDFVGETGALGKRPGGENAEPETGTAT